MADLFDIDFVTKSFGTTNLGHYLYIISKASALELHQFRCAVKSHQKQSQASQAFADTPWLTTHGAIIAAIDHELLKRSPLRFRVWSIIFSIRRFLVSAFSGMDLQRNEHFGALYATHKYRKTVWHMSHREVGKICWRFVIEHQKAIVASILSIVAALVIKWLAS